MNFDDSEKERVVEGPFQGIQLVASFTMDSVSDSKRGMGESPRAFCPPAIDEDQMATLVDNFAKEDSSESKTITRIIVERFLSKVCTQQTNIDNFLLFMLTFARPLLLLVFLVQSSTELQECSFLE